MFENLPSSSLGQHNRNMSNSNPTIHEPAKGHNKSVSMVGEAWMEDVIKYDNIAGNRQEGVPISMDDALIWLSMLGDLVVYLPYVGSLFIALVMILTLQFACGKVFGLLCIGIAEVILIDNLYIRKK